MKRIKNSLISGIALALLLTVPSLALAKKGDNKRDKGEDVRFRTSLTVEESLVDLADATGRLNYDVRKLKRKAKGQLKLNVKVPVGATSLGITDAATAAATTINVEFTREGGVVEDCTLSYNADDDDALPENESFNYRLHVKSNGNKEVKGSCNEGKIVPLLKETDTVTVYALVGGTTRVDFLSN